MGFLSDLGGSQAGTSLSNYLMQRRQEKRMDAGQARQAELQGMNIQQMGQRMKMNEQLMQMRQMDMSQKQNALEQQKQEQARRGQLTLFSDQLEKVPTGAQSGPAQMWSQLAQQYGYVRPDGKITQGNMEDLKKYVKTDPQLSTQMAMMHEQHWTKASEQLKQAMAGDPEGKQPSDKEMEDLQAQLQEVEQKKNMSIQANETLRGVNQKRTEINQQAFQQFEDGLQQRLVSAFGGVPNVYGMKGNPNSPDARKFKQVVQRWEMDQDRKEALDRQAKRERAGGEDRTLKSIASEYSKQLARLDRLRSGVGITTDITKTQLKSVIADREKSLARLADLYEKEGGNRRMLASEAEKETTAKITLPKNITKGKDAVKYLRQTYPDQIKTDAEAEKWLRERGG